MSISELRKYTSFCRKQGLLQLKTGDFEIVLHESSLKLAHSKKKSKDITKQEIPQDVLLWSAPDFPGE